MLRIAPVAIAGALLGAVGAIALSPLTPLPGTVARRADLHPGISIDAGVIGFGALVGTFVAIAVGVVAAVRTLRPSAGKDERRPRLRQLAPDTTRRPPAGMSEGLADEPGRSGLPEGPTRPARSRVAEAVPLGSATRIEGVARRRRP
jgi:hypothetical protein